MKRILCLILSLILVIGFGSMTTYAAKSDGLTISFGTAIYSTSKETFIRMVPEPASQAECGEDEFVTLIVNITNNSSVPVTLSNPCVKIAGGKALGGGGLHHAAWREQAPSRIQRQPAVFDAGSPYSSFL